MIKYRYKAVDLNKRKVSGVFLAVDKEDLRRQLYKQDIYLKSAKKVSDKSPNPFFSLTGKVKLSELTSFCRQFSIMINSSISIIDCLKILKTQSYSGYFKTILSIMHEDVNTGVLLSDAMKKHKRTFPEFFYNMVSVGEISGSLDIVLTNLADYYETDSKIKRKAKSAMSYPIVLLCMLIAVMGLMMLFVVPTFRDSLEKLEVELPTLTSVIFDVSDYLLSNWNYIAMGIILVICLLVMLYRTKKGRLFFDKLKIKLPLVGTVSVNLATARFARSFGILINSGLDVVKSLEIVAIIIGNKDIERRFLLAIDDVKRGNTISMSFEGQKLFPNILNQMISVGEKTGELSEVLLKTCNFFDEEVENSLNSLTAIIQPVMLIIMGACIGTIFVAIYSPMLAIMETL